MQRSTDRILTTHAGSLPRPRDLLALARAEPRDEKRYGERLAGAVKEVVGRQIGHGLDVVDDGEFGKPDFVGYINPRLAGFSPGTAAEPGFALRDVRAIPEYYEHARQHMPAGMRS